MSLISASILGIIAVFIGASEWLVRTHVAPNQNIEAHAAFLRTADRTSAAFGDSHVAMAVTGSSRIANLGYPANTLNHVIGKARLYFDRVVPDVVILQADPQQLVPGRLNREFENERPLFAGESWLFEALKITIPVYRENIAGHWRSLFAGSTFERVRDFNEVDGSQTAASTISDWSAERIDAFSKRVLQDQVKIVVSEAHPTVRRYEELIQWLTGKGARICLVAYPVDRAFYGLASQYPTEAAARALYQRLADDYRGIFLDYRTVEFPRDWFYDPDHLNEKGGRHFTRMLEKDCLEAFE